MSTRTLAPRAATRPAAPRRPGLLSWELAGSFARNLVRHWTQAEPALEPFVVAWFATYRCNLSCSYCILAEKGWTRGGVPELDTEAGLRLLGILRAACPNLYITGGEPLVRRDLLELLQAAAELDFACVSMVTNMSLLDRQPELLDHVDNLVVSMDSLDPKACAELIGAGERTARRIRENIVAAARLQREKGFRMAANFVINRGSIGHAREVLDFCRQHDIRLTVGPELSFDGRVVQGLREDPRYRALLDELIAERHDPAVLDSGPYLEAIRDLSPFRCHPSLTPRVSPMGSLYYPCRPLGGLEIDLLEAGSLAEAQRIGRERVGPPPRCEGRCAMNCYLTPTLFLERPLALIHEHLRGELAPRRSC